MDAKKMGMLCDKLESVVAQLRASLSGDEVEDEEEEGSMSDDSEDMVADEPMNKKGGKVGMMLAMMKKGKGK